VGTTASIACIPFDEALEIDSGRGAVFTARQLGLVADDDADAATGGLGDTAIDELDVEPVEPADVANARTENASPRIIGNEGKPRGRGIASISGRSKS